MAVQYCNFQVKEKTCISVSEIKIVISLSDVQYQRRHNWKYHWKPSFF